MYLFCVLLIASGAFLNVNAEVIYQIGFTPFINTTLVDHFEIVCNSGADSAVNISSIQLSAGQWGLEASCNGYQVVTYSSSNYIAVQLNPPLVFSLTFRSYHVSSYTNGMISTLSVH
ncbi:unnamed protein product, partial [Oppiella nova]